jgi:hypothetical protein
MNLRISLIAFSALAIVTAAATAADMHVASNGNDADIGTKENPFATPARAIEAVRGLISDGLKSDVHVVLHGGTYVLSAPLVFTSADSGSADYAIIYAAAAGETVVISGGHDITNWWSMKTGRCPVPWSLPPINGSLRPPQRLAGSDRVT